MFRRSRRGRALHAPQLVDRDVAAHQVAGLGLGERRLLLLADVADLPGASRVEDAARRRRYRARDLALQADTGPFASAERRHSGQQRLRVGMVRALEHAIGVAHLHEPAEIQHGDPIGEVPHDAQVVRDEHVRDAFDRLHVGEQVQDRGLHGDVERGRRLVADHQARLAGERARDGDALLQPARQLAGTHVDQPLVESDLARQMQDPFVTLRAARVQELRDGAPDDAADREPTVQRGVGVLEHDLHGAHLGRRALRDERGERGSVELHARSRVGGRQAEQDPSERRLAAAGLADQAERLAGTHLDGDVAQRRDRMALLMERLRDVREGEHGACRIRRDRGLGRLHRCGRHRQRLRPVVVVTAAGVPGAERDERRLLPVAAVVGERAPIGEDTPVDLGAERREEPGDGREPGPVLPNPAARDRAEQPHGVGVARVVEDDPRRALLDQTAGVQHADALAHLRDHGQVVADEQHARPEPGPQPGDQVEHLGLDRRVQPGGGLVQDQQLRLGRERHRDHDALLHPSRQLVRVPLHHAIGVGDLDRAEHLERALVRLVARRTADLEDLGDLPAHPHRGVQRRSGVLVDHRDGVGAALPHLVVAHAPQVVAVQQDRARGDASVAGQVPHRGEGRRGLTAPRLPDQAVGLAAPDLEGHPSQHPAVDPADAVDHVQLAELERGVVSSRCSGTALIVRTPGSRRRRSGSRRPRGSRWRAPGTASSTRSPR